MKILNPKNRIIGKVEQDGKNPFHFRYYGENKISFPIHANGEVNACINVCKYFGEGYTFLIATI